jgi:hypothetical protein
MPLATMLPPPGPRQVINAAKVGGGAEVNPDGLSVVKGTYVRVVAVATAADSITLPLTNGGDSIFVFNDGNASMNVFGWGGATINNAASVAQGAHLGAMYFSSIEGTWHRFLEG